MIGAGCFFWLERLRPLFFAIALLAQVYEVWLMRRRPKTMRSWSIRMILAVSLSLNLIVTVSWIILLVRYR